MLINLLTALLALVPGVTKATEAISRAVRSGKPAKPIPFGREHFWDEVAGWQHPPLPVTCVYCHATKAADNARAQCPGPPARTKTFL